MKVIDDAIVRSSCPFYDPRFFFFSLFFLSVIWKVRWYSSGVEFHVVVDGGILMFQL